MAGEIQGVFSLLGMPVTAYALSLGASVIVGLAALLWAWKRAGLDREQAFGLILWMLPLGLLGSRLFYCIARINYFSEIGLVNVLYLWNGGYALWGAVGGALTAAAITGRRHKLPLPKVLDALAPAAALTIALARFSECFSGEGIGDLVENPFFCRFPFALCNEWGEWYWAICILEGLVALVMLGVLLARKRPQGHTAKLFFILYSACQVLLESLRRDNYLRWLFVRVSQLTAVLVLVGLMAYALILWRRKPKDQRMGSRKMALCWGAFILCVGVCVAMEFAVDKWADLPNALAYGLMALCCAGLGSSAYQVVMKG